MSKQIKDYFNEVIIEDGSLKAIIKVFPDGHFQTKGILRIRFIGGKYYVDVEDSRLELAIKAIKLLE